MGWDTYWNKEENHDWWERPAQVVLDLVASLSPREYAAELAPHTFACDKSIIRGDIHYFSDEADLDELLSGFRIISRTKEEHRWERDGEDLFHSYWQVLTEKA